MLSFLKNGTKVTKTCCSEFGGLLWRHLTPQRKMAIYVHNYSASGAQKPQSFQGHGIFEVEYLKNGAS